MTLRATFSPSPSLLTLVTAGCLCALPACGDDDTPMPIPDAGPEDLGPPDLGPPPDLGRMYAPGTTCDDPHVLTGTATGEVSVMFDTTDEPPGMRDIGFDCGNQEAARWAPQHVIAYTVPGTGMQRVDFSLVNPGTGRRVDTVLQVRETCDRVPPSFPTACFDDASGSELRSRGATTAMGGDTIYLIATTVEDTMATGWSDRGPMELTVSARSASAPSITAGTVYVIGTRVEFNATGMDPDGDALGMRAVFLDAAGMPVDLSNGGGTNESDVPKLVFAPSVSGMTMFSGTAVFEGLTAFIDAAPVRPTQVDLSVFDEGYAEGAPLRLPLTPLAEVGTGEVCDVTSRCRSPLACETGLCAVTPEYAALCAAATPIPVPVPAGATTSASVAGVAGAGASRFAPTTCTNADGTRLALTSGETLFSVAVPAGTFDLTARTNLPATGAMEDTVLYVRAGCADPGAEVACNDDIDFAGRDYRSRIDERDVSEGTYTIFIEPFTAGTTTTFTLEVSLRPVLATGAACDPAQVLNRCAGTACPAGATPTCP